LIYEYTHVAFLSQKRPRNDSEPEISTSEADLGASPLDQEADHPSNSFCGFSSCD